MGKGEKKKDKKKEKKEKLAWSNPLLDVVESDEEDEDISPRDVPTSPELLEPLSPQLDLETGTPESGKKKGKKKNGKKWQNGKKDKKKAESNPMLDIDVLGSDEDISPRDASPGPELEPPSPKLASETGTGNTDPKGTVRWLKQRIAKQTAREQEMKLNWKYDPAIRQERDLGPIHPSWAFAFHMGIKDDGAPKDKWPKKQQWDDDDPIPLEAWILCHRLWKYDVHIQFSFSSLGDVLCLLVGLPYKVQVEEAGKMKISMRLKGTRGMHGFMREMEPRYAQVDGSCFNSSHRQGLTLFRIKATAKINPDTFHHSKGFHSKGHVLKHMQSRMKHRKALRGQQIVALMQMWGAHRPNSDTTIGLSTKRVRQAVDKDPWMLILPQEKLTAEQLLDEPITYDEVGAALAELKVWGDDPRGRFECFSGTFISFFALHDKKALQHLKEQWGTFAMARPGYVQGKDPEFDCKLSTHHPDNHPKKQFGPLWQPLDEIRDYFGDHVALYFVWMDLYTESLVWPAALGTIGMFIQAASHGGVDDNPFTVPYTIFFAAWSIVFLGAWKRRENECVFLWGSEGFEASERPRAQFVGAHVVNPETNRDEIIYTKPFLRSIKLSISFLISLACICMTIFCAIFATSIKDSPDHRLSEEEAAVASLFDLYKWKVVSAVLNLTIIVVFGAVYQVIAYLLTRWENHRTMTEFEDRIIGKNFMFQSINNYFVLFYVSIIRPFMNPCQFQDSEGSGSSLEEWTDASFCKRTDLPEIQLYLLIVYTGKTLGWRVGELAKPIMTGWVREMIALMRVRQVLKQLEAMEALAAAGGRGVVHTGEIVLHTGEVVVHNTETRIHNLMHHDHQQLESYKMPRKQHEGIPDDSESASDSDDDDDDEALVLSATQIQAQYRGFAERKRLAQEAEALKLAERVQGGDDDAAPAATAESDNIEDHHLPDHDHHPTAIGNTAKKNRAGHHSFAMAVRTVEANNRLVAAGEAKKKVTTSDIWRQLREGKEASKNDETNVEDEYALEPFESSFDQFNEMAVQYGYLALFAPAFPLAPLLAFINNIFEIRIDAIKFCAIHQRPRFRQAEDIGTWYTVLNVIAFLAVMMNAIMLTFVGSQMGSEDEKGGPEAREAGIVLRIYSQRLWVLAVIIEHGVMMMRIVIQSMSPEEPDWIADAKDTLQFRAKGWEAKIDEMVRKGSTTQEIHDAMHDDAALQMSVEEAKSTKASEMMVNAIPGGSLVGLKQGKAKGHKKMVPIND